MAALLAAAVTAQDEPATSDVKEDVNGIYDNLIFGMGIGTFYVLIAAFIGVLICFVKDLSYFPNCMVCLGMTLPVIVFLIILAWPKTSLSTEADDEDTKPTSNYKVWAIIYLSVISISLTFSLCVLMFYKYRTISIRRIDSEVGANQESKSLDSEVTGYSQATNNEEAADKREQSKGSDDEEDDLQRGDQPAPQSDRGSQQEGGDIEMQFPLMTGSQLQERQ